MVILFDWPGAALRTVSAFQQPRREATSLHYGSRTESPRSMETSSSLTTDNHTTSPRRLRDVPFRLSAQYVPAHPDGAASDTLFLTLREELV
jgi:hypothetical protein